MSEVISNLTMLHQELRHGSVAHVPRHLTHPVAKVLHEAMEASHHSRMTISIGDTPFEIFADLRATAQGTSSFYIAANRNLGGGRVQAGEVLYVGVSAVRLSTAPIAWRHLLRDYISAAASARTGVKFGSFAAMPRHLPWTAGFLSGEANYLSRNERDFLITVARLMAVRLVALGEKDSRAAERAGRDFTPDTEAFPELC